MNNKATAYDLGGVYPALLTPFGKNGNGINKSALGELIEFNINKGVRGFYVCGSSGEAFMMTEEERMSVYEMVAERVAGRVKLIAQVGSISTDQAKRFAKRAKELNYDAVSAVSPFYYSFKFPEIKQYYQSIIAASEMPMVMYNVPCTSNVNFSIGQIGDILSMDGVIGLKHTAADFFALEQLKSRFSDKVIFNGFDEMFLSGLAMGADGAIGSTFNHMAEKFIEIQKLFEENKMEEALAVQREANRIIGVLIECGVMQSNKEILCQMGIDVGEARAPFAPLSEEQKNRLKAEVTDKL